jgi:hypothetical protein
MQLAFLAGSGHSLADGKPVLFVTGDKLVAEAIRGTGAHETVDSLTGYIARYPSEVLID